MLSAAFHDLGDGADWPWLFHRPHQVHGHFPHPWNFIYYLQKLLYLSGWSWFRFSIPGVLNCDLSHRWSVAVLCMLYKIRCNPKHPLCGDLPVPYVPVRVTHGALIYGTLVYFCASPLQNLTVPQDFEDNVFYNLIYTFLNYLGSKLEQSEQRSEDHLLKDIF